MREYVYIYMTFHLVLKARREEERESIAMLHLRVMPNKMQQDDMLFVVTNAAMHMMLFLLC